MKKFLKKLETENFRMRFLNFSEIDCWDSLDNHTRIKSFILKGEFEIAVTKWYSLYIQLVRALQKINPLSREHLLSLTPFKGRCKPFNEHRGDGYIAFDDDLYLRLPTSANDVVYYVSKLLRRYGYDLSDAYLIVELNRESILEESEDIINEEKEGLLNFLRCTFVKGEEYFDMAINAIDEMNDCLSKYTNTSYNNLYLLGSSDYSKYAYQAIELQFNKGSNTFTKRQLQLAVDWLNMSRFFGGDFLNPIIKNKDRGLTYIDDDNNFIEVTFKTHFFDKEENDNA